MVFFGNFLLTTKESYSCRGTKRPSLRPQAQHLFAAVRFPSRNRRFPDRCRSPDCACTAFRCRCLLLRQKLFVLPCRRLRNNYILCPTGTPTFAAARRQRRDLIIAKNDQRTSPYPHCCQRQRRKDSFAPRRELLLSAVTKVAKSTGRNCVSALPQRAIPP